MFVRIELGQRRIHGVALDQDLTLANTWITDAAEMHALAGLLQDARVIAIDAAGGLSSAPHHDDQSLSPKFRSARCAEIALGRDRRISVPWATPTEEQPSPGMDARGIPGVRHRTSIGRPPHRGLSLRRLSRAGGHEDRFQADGSRPASACGATDALGMSIDGLEMWSHDSLDACLAALIAHDAERGSRRQ